MADGDDLPLFFGPHVPRIRFENALARFDLRAAAADAPAEWREAVIAMAKALGNGRPARSSLHKLLACRCSGWPDAIERTWQRLVGLRLDAHKFPRTLDEELAAAYLLRGGDAAAAASLRRHLEHQPRDVRGWELLARFEPVRGAARCGFHGGRVLERLVAHLLDAITEDELRPAGRWLLAYGWFADQIDRDEMVQALDAEQMLASPPLPVVGDAAAFTWYLLDAGGRPLGPGSVGVVEARRRLQRISRAAFRRYLTRVEGKPL